MTAGCDTRDLLVIHAVLRSLFGRASEVINAANEPRRALRADRHLREICDALHRHHHGEDLMLWDRLSERSPACALHVDRMRAQHERIAVRLDEVRAAHDAWRTDRDGGRAPLIAAIDQLNVELNDHLADEELNIRPVAGSLLSQSEWDGLRDHGIRTMPKGRILIQLGYMMRAMETDAERAEFFASVPPPVRVLYRLFGERQLSRELTELYSAPGARP